MANNGPGQSESADYAAQWPIPKFHFSVDLGCGGTASFSEVSGMNVESQITEYRFGDETNFTRAKMPGLKKYDNVTMKNGIFKGDMVFRDWYNKITMNTIERTDVKITLMDDKGGVLMLWTLKNAWPTRITVTDMKADGNEVAVETLELAHEGLTQTKGF
ncbi:MAG: phage tail protein [Bacteroidetes bacterium]|nr:phage tail protein [Bacteroidota bacterium]